MKVILKKNVYKGMFPEFYKRRTKMEIEHLEDEFYLCTIIHKKGYIKKRFVASVTELIGQATE